MALLKETTQESGDQRAIAEEFGPFTETQIGCNDCALAVTSIVHESEEIIGESLVRRSGVAEFVYAE